MYSFWFAFALHLFLHYMYMYIYIVYSFFRDCQLAEQWIMSLWPRKSNEYLIRVINTLWLSTIRFDRRSWHIGERGQCECIHIFGMGNDIKMKFNRQEKAWQDREHNRFSHHIANKANEFCHCHSFILSAAASFLSTIINHTPHNQHNNIQYLIVVIVHRCWYYQFCTYTHTRLYLLHDFCLFNSKLAHPNHWRHRTEKRARTFSPRFIQHSCSNAWLQCTIRLMKNLCCLHWAYVQLYLIQ